MMKQLRIWLCAKLIPDDVMVIGRGTWSTVGLTLTEGQRVVAVGSNFRATSDGATFKGGSYEQTD